MQTVSVQSLSVGKFQTPPSSFGRHCVVARKHLEENKKYPEGYKKVVDVPPAGHLVEPSYYSDPGSVASLLKPEDNPFQLMPIVHVYLSLFINNYTTPIQRHKRGISQRA